MVEIERVGQQADRVGGIEVEDEVAGENGQVIDREDAQRAAHVEVLERDPPGLGALAQQQTRDEKAGDHEEDVERDIADARRHIDVQERVIDAAFEHRRAVGEDHHHHADSAKAIESREFLQLPACACILRHRHTPRLHRD
nr:hypothetical protein [Tardiphaga alba]